MGVGFIRLNRWGVFAFALAVFSGPVGADAQIETPTIEIADVDANIATAPTPIIPELIIPALSEVDLAIMAPLSSKTAKIGEMFPIRLASPIMIDGKVVVPADIVGEGEVIHAAKARAGGKAGELILAARYLDWNGSRIALRSFKFGQSTGKSNTGEAFTAGAIVSPVLTLLIAGGEVVVPSGTPAVAKLARDVLVPGPAQQNQQQGE